MSNTIDLKQDKNLSKLYSVLSNSPFGSTMSQIMNDCRISNKTAKHLLETADFVRKENDLYFVKSHILEKNEKASDGEPVKQVEEKKSKVEKAKVKLISEMTFNEIIDLPDTGNPNARLNAFLCSNPEKVGLSLHSLLSNLNPNRTITENHFIRDLMEKAMYICDAKQNLMVYRRAALKKLLQLTLLRCIPDCVDITKTSLLNIPLENIYPDEINKIVDKWDFDTPLLHNQSHDYFYLNICRIYIKPYIDFSDVYKHLKKPLFDSSLNDINSIENIDLRTIAILCSHWDYAAEEIMFQTKKEAGKLINDAKKIISCAFLSIEYRFYALSKYLELKAVEFGLPFNKSNIDVSVQDKLNADHTVFAEIEAIQGVFKQCIHESSHKLLDPFKSNIFEKFINRCESFESFVVSVAENLSGKGKEPTKPTETLEAQTSPESIEPLKVEVMTLDKKEDSKSEDMDKQPVSIKEKFGKSVKEKRVKSLSLSIEEVEQLLKELFDMDEVSLSKKNNIVLGFDLKSERDL